jgi:glycopeptide antibiotics resistance protein
MAMARAHAVRHCGMFSLVFRVMCYSTALFAIMFASDRWFGDTYTANLCLFILFSVVFEMLWANIHTGPRFWWYLVCVAGIALTGTVLVREGLCVQQHHCESIERLE